MAASPAVNQYYRIAIQGHLDQSWTEWFDGLTLTHEPTGCTVITGTLADQAALYRLLIKLRDLGLPLLSVNLIKQGERSCF